MAGTCDVAMVGLGVMGRNLALNLADHGYSVAGFDLSPELVTRLQAEDRRESPNGKPGKVVGAASAAELLALLKSPRVIIALVPAGKAVDAVCDSLIAAGARAEDIVVDAGNSLWTDTIEREKKYRGRLTFFGSGVSGGETGARFGPSLMPGGDQRAWARLKPMWESIAAKVDASTGRPLEGAAPGRPVTGGEPCTTYVGENGAGHYVKMVHNGIEYADMQLICEAYHLLRESTGRSPRELADVFAEWNAGDLDSFLIEITADILRQSDPVTGRPFVDIVLDAAGQKGTGKWTAVNALDLGVPAMSIAEAVFARTASAIKEERVVASKSLAGPATGAGGESIVAGGPTAGIAAIRDALYCSKIAAYAQGFQLMRAAQAEYKWTLDFAEIARIWRGGCIIRARFLQKITDAFRRDPALANLLLDQYFRDELSKRHANWRAVVAWAIKRGIPVPAFGSAIAYYDSYRTPVLPANLLQAQRDYFGAHTYERVDQPRGKKFHLDWPKPGRPQSDV